MLNWERRYPHEHPAMALPVGTVVEEEEEVEVLLEATLEDEEDTEELVEDLPVEEDADEEDDLD